MPNSLSRLSQQKAKFSHSILSANNLLILCALFDLVATTILVTRRYEELIAVNINPVFPATHFIAYPFLLLVACVEYWWTYSESYRWNIIRLPITALILIYSIISLLRLIRRHRTKGNKMLLSNTEAA